MISRMRIHGFVKENQSFYDFSKFYPRRKVVWERSMFSQVCEGLLIEEDVELFLTGLITSYVSFSPEIL